MNFTAADTRQDGTRPPTPTPTPTETLVTTPAGALTPTPVVSPTETPTTKPSTRGIPIFEAVFVIAGLLAALYPVLRRRE